VVEVGDSLEDIKCIGSQCQSAKKKLEKEIDKKKKGQ
jgi:hypothetical protein